MKRENNTSIFIENMINEFIDYLPLDAIFKLWVIYGHNQNMKSKDIVELIEKKSLEDNITKNHSADEIEDVKSVYRRDDQKKISRLKKYTSPSLLLSAIGYGTFIHTVLAKYPYPFIIGFPFNEWTEKRMHKYIRLFFNIPKSKRKRGKIGIKMPSNRTIKNEIRKYQNDRFDLFFSFSLKDILQYYLEQETSFDFYYLYLEKRTYKISSQDQSASHISNRYNETLFYTLFSLADVVTCKRVHSVSYNSMGGYCLNFDNIINNYKNELSTSKHNIVFFINTSHFIKALRYYYSELKQLPNISFIMFTDLDEVNKALEQLNKEYTSKNDTNKDESKTHTKNIASKIDKVISLEENIERLQTILNDLSSLKMNSRSEKSKYIKEMREIINRL